MAWMMKGIPAKMKVPTTRRRMYMVLLPTVIWLGGMKLTRKAARLARKPSPPTIHMPKVLPPGMRKVRGVFGSR